MTVPARSPGAPRLLEWTGERCVPWTSDVAVVYEHYHRYLFAASLVAGRAVLDLGSGEGFGSAILAERARSVLGVDVEPVAVEHASLNYHAPNLSFRVADARALDMLPDGSFEAIVAFEMIEHLAEHEQVMAEVARLLTPGGLLIISTPERRVYSEASGYRNPYHVRELTTEELVELLRPRFPGVALWGQRMIAGSLMAALADGSSAPAPREGWTPQTFLLERRGEEWRSLEEITPRYVIAVACAGELPPAPPQSVLGDQELALVGAAEEARERAVRAVADLSRLVDELQDRAAADARVIGTLQSDLAAAQAFRAGVEGSTAWRLLQQGRRLLYRGLGGRESSAGRLLGALIRLLGRRLGGNP